MAKTFKGVLNLEITQFVPDWGPYAQPVAPEGSPNVLYIVLDDVGFSAMEPFGGLIGSANINEPFVDLAREAAMAFARD